MLSYKGYKIWIYFNQKCKVKVNLKCNKMKTFHVLTAIFLLKYTKLLKLEGKI